MKNTAWTWKIDSVSVLEQLANYTNVVCLVAWTLTGKNANGQASKSGTQELFSPVDGFVPFEQLDEDCVIDWVQKSMGDLAIESIKNAIDYEIIKATASNIVPVEKPLPWLS